MKILVAGIGNIFYRDDAFGCEVVRELQRRDLPDEVTVTDFGVRSYDLTYALTEGFDTVILVDAIPRGEEPGGVYLIEPDAEELKNLGQAAVDAHVMNPVAAIQMAQSFGDICEKIFLIGCEPEILEDETGKMGLSEKVEKAVPEAVMMIKSLIANILGQQKQDEKVAGFVPV